jgi:hypothetical protein
MKSANTRIQDLLLAWSYNVSQLPRLHPDAGHRGEGSGGSESPKQQRGHPTTPKRSCARSRSNAVPSFIPSDGDSARRVVGVFAFPNW